MPSTPNDVVPLPAAHATDTTLDDRRRPGRLNAHPALVPLLRMPPNLDDTVELDDMEEEVRRLFEHDEQPAKAVERDDTNRLTAARGLTMNGSLSVALWSMFGLGIGYLLRGML